MSKVTIALGSFIIGACFAFTIVPGNASTFAQQVLGAVPVVPSLEPVVTEDSTISGARFLLDRIFARHMNFSNVTKATGSSSRNSSCRHRPLSSNDTPINCYGREIALDSVRKTLPPIPRWSSQRKRSRKRIDG